MDNKELIRVSPEAAGIKSSRILKLIKDLEATGNEIHGFMVARGGKVLAETWMAPYAANIPHSCHSLGKSYTCTGACSKNYNPLQNCKKKTDIRLP